MDSERQNQPQIHSQRSESFDISEEVTGSHALWGKHVLSGASKDARAREHYCSIHSHQADALSFALPLVGQKQGRHERTIYIADHNRLSCTLKLLTTRGFDVETLMNNGDLTAFDSGGFRGDAGFDTQCLPDLIRTERHRAECEEYDALKLVVDMDCMMALRPNCAQMLEMEAVVADLVRDRNCSAICQYSIDNHEQEFLLNVLRVHPKAIIDGVNCENFYYVPHLEQQSHKSPTAIIDRCCSNLRTHARLSRERNGYLRELKQQMRKLKCLYGISELVSQPGVTLHELLQDTADLIPRSLQWHITGVRITLDDEVFNSRGFHNGIRSHACRIVVNESTAGLLEVFQNERVATINSSPSHRKDNEDFISAIAERMGRVIERRRAEEAKHALQEELTHSRKLEAIGTLAAGVAHDFNNLLTVIRGHTSRAVQMLSEKHDARQELAVVESATEHASEVSRSLLGLTHRAHCLKEPVLMCETISESVELIRRLLPASIAVEVDRRCNQRLWVMADKTQLQQVIMNLAINARDSMPDGGRLCVAIGPVSEAHCDIARESGHSERGEASAAFIEMSDTGAGMSDEQKARAFEPYFTTKARHRGTGLGLAIVHSIVQDHAGVIAIESELGVGTKITITLPCMESKAHEESMNAFPKLAYKGTLALVAEDDHHVRGVISLMLQSLGCRVILAEDGLKASKLIEQHGERIGLLVLDVDMPGQSGTDCLLRLRQKDIATPALLISGGDRPAMPPCIENTTILCKPFGMSQLSDCLEDAFANTEPSAVNLC